MPLGSSLLMLFPPVLALFRLPTGVLTQMAQCIGPSAPWAPGYQTRSISCCTLTPPIRRPIRRRIRHGFALSNLPPSTLRPRWASTQPDSRAQPITSRKILSRYPIRRSCGQRKQSRLQRLRLVWHLVTAPAKTSPFSETLRFYQDPGATTDIVIAGNITTTFYVDRNPGSGVVCPRNCLRLQPGQWLPYIPGQLHTGILWEFRCADDIRRAQRRHAA